MSYVVVRTTGIVTYQLQRCQGVVQVDRDHKVSKQNRMARHRDNHRAPACAESELGSIFKREPHRLNRAVLVGVGLGGG